MFEELTLKKSNTYKDPSQKPSKTNTWNNLNQYPTKQVTKVLRPKIVSMDNEGCQVIMQRMNNER